MIRLGNSDTLVTLVLLALFINPIGDSGIELVILTVATGDLVALVSHS